MGVMDRYNEKKKKKEEESQSKTTSGGVAERYERNQYYQTLDTDSVDENYINTFLSDTNSFFGGVNQNSFDYDTAKSTLGDLSTRYDTIQGWLYKNKSKLNEEAYKSLSSTFDGLQSSFSGVKDYYSQWASAEDYNKYLQAQKDYEALVNFDTDAGAKEIDALNAEYEAFVRASDYDYTDNDSVMAYRDKMDDYETAINEKKLFLNRAKRTQEGIELASVSGNDDFSEYSGYTAGKERLIPDYDDVILDFVNKNYDTNMAIGQAWNKISDNEIDRLYSTEYMTDDERAIYNYYYNKDGFEAAEHYLDIITETLNYRKATEQYKKLEGKPWAELAFGIPVGFDQANSGLRSLLNTEGEYVPQSSLQMASGMVREDLANFGPKTPDWIGGNSLGQMGYDTVTTTSNMLPSILTSTVIGSINPVAGQIVGTAMMGASAAGNAYQEMLNLGYDQNQARNYAALVGASEAGLEYLIGGISSLGGELTGNAVGKLLNNVDNAFARVAIQWGGSMASEFTEEYLQEVLTPWFQNLTLNTDNDIDLFSTEALYSGILGALTAGFMEGPGIVTENASYYKQGKSLQKAGVTHGQLADIGGTFSAESVAYQLAGRVNENTGAYTMGRLFNEINATMTEQNVADIQENLVTKGMRESDASKLANALAAVVTDPASLTRKQAKALEANPILAQAVIEEIIEPGSAIGTRLQSYSEILRSVMGKSSQKPQEAAETTGEQVAAETQNVAQTAQTAAVEAPTETIEESTAVEAQQETEPVATGKESLQVAEESTVTEEAKAETVSLDDAAKKYGAQAQAMIHTYQAGQDVAEFDKAYKAAYDMGRSGVALSYVHKSDMASYLTDSQKELAYEAGKAAADAKAIAKDAANKAAANGKTGWKKGGVVRGEGVTIADLRKAVGDTRGKAYKALSTIAKVTGINIVLYKSQTDANSNFIDAQGEFNPDNPNELRIDINAGLENINDVGELEKYVLLRTFSHEFTHFIEKWNPIQYNEFRRFVFDTMTQRGQDVNRLIELQQEKNPGMGYEAASREVVAEAMTDILPDSNFVQMLAEKHQNIFKKLMEKLKEFASNLREYFDNIGYNEDAGANSLKEDVDGAIKYVDSIVQLFDKVAVQAVENSQKTVAVDEVVASKKENTTTVSETESVATSEETAAKVETVVEETTAEVEETAPEATTSEHGFTITDNAEYGSLEITFDGKPPKAVLDALKSNKFRWHKAKKVWYGKADRSTITEVLNKAFEAETVEAAASEPEQSDFEKAFWNASQAERDEVVDAINENTKISHMAPTEIRESAPVAEVEEVTSNGENANNQGAVLAAEPDGRGAARLLDEVEAGDVPGDGGSGNTVADAGERGQTAGRDGDRPDSQRSGGGPGEGDRQSGDLRGTDRVTEESATGTNVGSKLHEEVVEQIAQQSTEQPKGRNFVIGDSLDLPSGEKSRYKANVEAIRLVKKLEAEGRYATEAEQAILSKYVGWGGLANAFDQRKAEWAKEYAELKELLTDEEYSSARGSTLNAHYTDISVIRAMYDGLKQLGFTGGRMMEPSSGVGNFVGAMPADMASQVRSWTMVELDGITGLIAKYLYPNADVRIQGFEKANIPNNFMDVAISNVPFGNYAIADKSYPKKVTSAIHNYFFAKSLDKVRPGGIVMFITSSYTMNSSDSTVRRYIMQKADLLGAIRLPDTAFKGNAGTEVVTDILVLKKRAENTNYAGEDFLEAPYKYVSGYNGAYINSYFDNHPEMVLGTPSMEGGMYRGANLTYKALEGKGSLADQIREAFRNIQGKMDYPAKQSPEKTNFAVERAGKKIKENGLVVKEGKVYKNTGGELVEQKVAKGTAERIAGMLGIRDAARALQNAQQQGLKESEIKKARQKLNKLYDEFVKKHGFINAQANKNAIMDDPDRYSILALENWNPETKKATKSDVFSKDTIAPNRTVTTAKDVSEGLIVSVNQTGGVDAALIARLTGKTVDDVTRELIDSRAVFKNRDGELETAEVYLSGNVRAKLRDAEAMVPIDADYQKNVEALKAVMPEDVSYEEIFVNPGTPWIPDSVYSDFAAHILGGRNTDWRKDVIVTRNKDTGNFTVELGSKYLKTNASNTQKWGTSRRSFLDLFDAMLNSKSVVVKYKTDDGKSVIDQDATAAANEKVEAIQKEFQEWLWKDETRRGELATLYNEIFNSIVTPTYNGDNLTVNGANAMKPLRPHQRNAVQRIIASGGNTLLAHKVGAGKTYEMAAAAMKLKELGLVKKPMFAVPKSLVAQWGNEFMDFFPTAKLLVAEAGDFTAANRKVFMNRIANGDYDAVIVSYEQFERLPMSADFTRELYQEQIDSVIRAIEDAKAEKGGKSLSVKDLEKKRKSLQTKIDKLTDTAKDEGNIDFEQLGVDSIFVDEAHNFKNLFYTTSMTNVSGLGNKDGSKRAFDLYTKVRYLQKLNGGRGIVFATATPVMNSMSEMYIMQKYLQPDLLDQLGLSTFDAWAKQFGEVVNGVEIKPSGQGYRVKQSFSRFKNMSELQLLFRNFADVLTDIPGLKIPKMKGGKVNVVVCEPGQFQQDYMKELEKRADSIKNVDPSVDNMLKITSDGRKISYTQRMIDPSLPYEEGCKIFRCADNVLAKYQESKDIKGTQIIFCDMATPKGKSSAAATETEEIETDMESAKLYDDIKARLIQGGIPAREIAFIHEADTDAKKKKLFADVNDGKVRVLIGSTGKMGVGMNAQKRIVAIHHLDAPWRPGDVEQRNGRAYRQGNINDEVENFTYVTEGSFDARLWDILERKQNFINQVMNGENVGRETEDTGEVTLSAAEVKALASGSPLIMEQVQLDTDIKKLESLYRAHRSAVANARSRMETDKGNIATFEKFAANGKKDLTARVDTYSEGKFSITVGKQKFTDKKDAGAALMAEATAKATEEGYTTIGKFAGFDLRVIKTHEGIKGQISGSQAYSFNTYPSNTTYMISHLIAKVEAMDEAVKLWEHKISEAKQDLAEQEKLINQPFAKQAELDKKRARYHEVMEILNPKEEQALDSMDEDTVQYQRRKPLEDWNSYELDPEFLREVDYVDRHLFLRSLANQTSDIADGGSKHITIVSGSTMYFFHATGYMNGNIEKKVRITSKNQARLIALRKEYTNVTYTGRETFSQMAQVYEMQRGRDGWYHDAAGDPGATGQNDDVDVQASGSDTVGSAWDNYGYSSWEELLEAVSDGVMIMDENGNLITNKQYQQRTNTLTNREVLALAASELQTADMSAAERDALGIFQQRLAKLETLQDERSELGRLYKEQQFGAKVDRAAAEQTRNRMKVLDGQIEKAKAEVLSIEDKQVLKQVLQKARKVVEKHQWAKDEEKLKRYRDRRNNADAIKKYRERLTKDVNDLTSWVLHPNNKDIVKHIPDVLKSSVIPFLSSIDFTSKRSLSGGDATKADKEFMKRLNGLKAALKPGQSIDGLYGDYSDLPPNFMERLQLLIDSAQAIVDSKTGEFVVNQMTSQELRELSQVVRTLKTYIQQFNRFHANAMFQHVSEAGDNTIGELGQMNNASDKTGNVSNFVFWQQIRPAYAWERFGEGGKAIYDGLRRGQATLAFNTKKIQEFAEKAYTEAEVKAWEKEIKAINLGGDIVRMPVSTIMSFYELSKRPQALGHILGGGIRVATFTAKGKKISDTGHTITPGDLQTIIGTLTDRQKEVADTLQKFMQEQGGKWGNYVSVKRFGEELFGEDHYFPINSDGRHLAANADEHPSAASLYALLNMGFTKAVQEGANNRVVLYSIFDVFANHMASMAQYNAFALPVVDAIKWFNYQQKSEADEDGKRIVLGSVRDQMDRVYGVPEETRPGSGRQGYAQSFVINILRAFNGTEAQGVPTDSTGLTALRQYNMAQVAFNFRVVVQQPLAITRAASLIDYGSIIKGMRISPAAIQKNIQEMQRYSGIAAWKSLGFYDVNISRGLTDIIKHSSTVRDKISNVGMWGAEKADLLTWAGIWSACKEEVIKKQKLTPKSEGFYEAVTKLFEDVVYKTQVVDSVLTKNEYLRSKGFFARAIGSFMSEPTTTASMLIDAYDKYHADLQRGMNRTQAWKKNGKKIVRTAYVYGLNAAILAAVQAVADAFRDDDDYQEWYEKWLEAFGGNLVDEVMPLNKLPILSDFYEVAKELLSILGVDTYGNAPTSVFMQWYDSLVKGVEILYDKISGEDTNYTWYGGAYKLLQAVSGMTGLPMAAATREIVTTWNNIVGSMAPSLKVKTYEPSAKTQIKYAYQDGYLTDQEAMDQLLQQGLVDNEDEAYWTVQGWEAGDGYSRYDAIYDAVRTGGDFNAALRELTSHGYTEKDIRSQVKSKIGTWYKDGEITKQQATDMLTKYSEMDSEDITATVNKWSSKVVTGIAFEDIKDEYLAGNITASRAIDMRMRYGGETKEEAQNTVGEWTFELEHPELDGRITYTQYKRWETNGKPNGVSVETFTDVAEFRDDGTSDSVKSQEEVAAYINALNISYAQKDALWCCFWKESTLKNAPWH